jgi:hypothetical protein
MLMVRHAFSSHAIHEGKELCGYCLTYPHCLDLSLTHTHTHLSFKTFHDYAKMSEMLVSPYLLEVPVLQIIHFFMLKVCYDKVVFFVGGL